MKKQIAKASMFLMGIFAYLILSIALYQSAWAEETECKASQACIVHMMFNANTDDGEVAGAMAISNSVAAYVAGFADALATAAVASGDRDWYKLYTSFETALWSCPYLSDTTWRDVYRAWLTYSLDKQQMRTSSVTTLFMNTVCEKEIQELSGLFALPPLEPRTGTKS